MTDYRIGPMPLQLPAALIRKLEQVETATVGHSRHWGFMDRGIQPLLRAKRIAGTAVTLAIPGPDSTLLHHALGLLRPGDILVVDRLGDQRHACWGGAVTIGAKAAGAVAGIVDGPCTDFNVMTRRGAWTADVTTRRSAFEQPSADVTLLLCGEGEWRVTGPSPETLGPMQALLWRGPTPRIGATPQPTGALLLVRLCHDRSL